MMTFIIPCFNQINHTKKCVESIQKNSKDFNFVFIDNGSTDGTYAYLKSIKNAHVIRNARNLYVNPAWNQGFKHVLDNDLGEHICLCNNDVVVGKNWLKSVCSLFSFRDEFYIPAIRSMDEIDNYKEDYTLSPILCHVPGFCVFLKKKYIDLFYPIPDKLKVIRGDDWIMDNLYSRNIFGYVVSNCNVFHEERTTQRIANTDNMLRDDVREYERLVREVYSSRGIYKIGDILPKIWL